MMMTHTGNASSLQWQEVGRRKGTKEVVVKALDTMIKPSSLSDYQSL